MARTTLLTSVTATSVMKSLSASNLCGQIIIDVNEDQFVEEMKKQLTGISFQIYTKVGEEYIIINNRSYLWNFGMDLSIPIFDIPSECYIKITGVIDSRYSKSNPDKQVYSEFPISIYFDNSNIRAGGSGSGGTTDFDSLNNRPSYNGSLMTHETSIPEVKTSTWDAKQDALTAGENITISSSNVISASCNVNSYTNKSQIADYLYELQYTRQSIDQEYCYNYFTSSTSDDLNTGGCTGVYYGKKVLRQYDWEYDNACEFVVRVARDETYGKYGSIGIASTISGLTAEFVGSGAYSTKYKIVPYCTTDGVNEKGLYIQENVTPKKSFTVNITHTCEESQYKGKITGNMIPRIVLDNCASVSEVEIELKKYDIERPSKLSNDYDFHFLIADSTGAHKIIEFTGTESSQTISYLSFRSDAEVITNFGCETTGAISSDGELDLDWDIINNNGSTSSIGLERFELAAEEVKKSSPDISSLRSSLNYTKFYTATSNIWYSELAGTVYEGTTITTIMCKTPSTILTNARNVEISNYNSRVRGDKKTWQTVHSCVYDLTKLSINIVIQERDDTEFNICLNNSGNVSLSMLSSEYSNTSTYQLGDYCLKDGDLYRCTTNISTAEEWNPDHWSLSTKIGNELSYILKNMIYFSD